MTVRISSSVARTAGGRALSARASSGIGSSRRSSGSESRTGPGPATEGLADRLGHRVGDLVGRVRFGGPLGEPAERRDLVDLLEGLAPEQGALDLADRHEHRGGILARGMDPDGEIGSHRPRGSRARSRVARSAGRGPRP